MVDPLTITQGLSAGVKLIKQSVDLFSSFETKKQKLFKEFIDPAFNALKPVINSYADDIAILRKKLVDANTYPEVNAALDEYNEERRKSVQAREELISTLQATAEYWETKVAKSPAKMGAFGNFMYALRAYFSCVRDTDYLARKSASIGTRAVVGEEVGVALYHSQSLAGNLIDEVAGRLNIAIKTKKKTELKKFKQDVVAMCDKSNQLLEKRRGDLFKSYTTLKLECT